MKPRAYVAELVGTFLLALAVLVSIRNPNFPVSTPLIAGIALGVLVYTIGPMSGTHINPAATLALASVGRIGLTDAAAYIVAQLIGGGLAMIVGGAWFGPGNRGLPVENTAAVGLAEMMGAAILVFGIAAVVFGVVPKSMAGVVIGASLTLGISFAAHASNGVLNPAVALGIGSLSFAYVWGPVLGGVVGAWLLRALAAPAGGRDAE